MKSSTFVTAVFVALAVSVASADNPPGWFEYTESGGLIPMSGDTEGVSFFSLTMDDDLVSGTRPSEITWLELELTGLTHTNPWDLDIYLIDPFGQSLEIMTDRGDQVAIVNVDLIFNDKADMLPPENAEVLPGAYLPEGSGGFGIFDDPGTDAWILVMIDDSEGNQGNLGSFTLRGVPEPVTLSLLLVGAFAALRRRY